MRVVIDTIFFVSSFFGGIHRKIADLWKLEKNGSSTDVSSGIFDRADELLNNSDSSRPASPKPIVRQEEEEYVEEPTPGPSRTVKEESSDDLDRVIDNAWLNMGKPDEHHRVAKARVILNHQDRTLLWYNIDVDQWLSNTWGPVARSVVEKILKQVPITEDESRIIQEYRGFYTIEFLEQFDKKGYFRGMFYSRFAH